MKVKQKFIPAKTTSYLQPVDVGINDPFKIALREEWNFWFEHGPKEFTPKGYQKMSSYDYVLKMVSNTLKKITPDIIKRSFEACGVKPNGQKVEAKCLNVGSEESWATMKGWKKWLKKRRSFTFFR